MSKVKKQWSSMVPWTADAQIGCYPRVIDISANVERLPYFEAPECVIDPEKIVFDGRSVLTDVIFEDANKDGSVWIVSSKLRSILSSFKLPRHNFYKIPKAVRGHQNIDADYSLFVIFDDLANGGIDFEKSQFSTVSQMNFLGDDEPCEAIHISSRDDYIEKIREQLNLFREIRPSKLVLSEPIQYDLFALRIADYFVSDELVSEFRKEKITGFDLTPVDFDIIEQ